MQKKGDALNSIFCGNSCDLHQVFNPSNWVDHVPPNIFSILQISPECMKTEEFVPSIGSVETFVHEVGSPIVC